MKRLLGVAAGGAVGALLRFVLINLAAPLDEYALHAAALGANLIGCFLIGLLWVWARERAVTEEINALVFAGLLGSFTTFSTYALVSVTSLLEDNLLFAGSYVAVSNTAGLALVYLGVVIGTRCFGHST